MTTKAERRRRNSRNLPRFRDNWQPEFECCICDISYSKFKDLKRHRKTIQHTRKQKLRRFSCKTCGTQFTKEDNLIRHNIDRHKTAEHEKIRCDYCSSTFFRFHDLDRHINILHVEEPNRVCCNICDRTFSHQSNLNRHLRSVHMEERFKCKECPASFARNDDLLKHKTGRKHYWELYCTFCEQELVFKTEEDMKAHFGYLQWNGSNSTVSLRRKLPEFPDFCVNEVKNKPPDMPSDYQQKRECSVQSCTESVRARG